MPETATIPSALSSRPSGVRWIPMVLAVGVSLLAHVLVFQAMPGIPLLESSAAPTRRQYRKVALDQVRLKAMPPPPEVPDLDTAQLRPESPRDLARRLAPFEEAVAELLPDPELAAEVFVQGSDMASGEPALPEPDMSYIPREEILQVEQKLFADNIETAPRRVVASVPREVTGLDIKAPTDWGEASLRAAVARTGIDAAAQVLPSASALGEGSLGAVSVPLAPPDLIGEPIAPELGSGSDPVMEKPEEVTEVEAVETMLGVEVATFEPPDEPGELYFRIQIFREGIEALPVIPKDIVFIQDCSESMSRAKLARCKAGLLQMIEDVGPQDRFNILGFRDDVTLCFPSMVKPSPTSLGESRLFIEEMRSRGRTDVSRSLTRMLEIPRDAGRPMVAVLVTDGRPTMGLLDSSEIIEAFTQSNQDRVSMFAVGGGERANRYLLDLLSYRNRGDSLLVPERDEIPSAITELGRQLRRPVMVNLRTHFRGGEDLEVYPQRITHLFVDRPLVLYGRTRGDLDEVLFQVIGNAAQGEHDMIFQLMDERRRPGGSSLRLEWARQKLYDLIGQYTDSRSEEVLQEMTLLARRYGLAVPYAYDLTEPVRP